jgi:TetR/AcrR family transcriptional regulator, lmrAB and yxaGH operons repressor
MPRLSTARDRLIRAAVTLFRQRGYDGVGLTEILKAADAPKGSFYHHFPGGKEQLAVVAVDVAGRAIERLLEAEFQQASSFPDGAHRCIEAIALGFEKSVFKEGCPITGVALDMIPQSPMIAAAARAAFANWQALLVRWGRHFGEKTFSEDDALGMVMLIEGAWVMARVQMEAKPIRTAARIASALLASKPE